MKLSFVIFVTVSTWKVTYENLCFKSQQECTLDAKFAVNRTILFRNLANLVLKPDLVHLVSVNIYSLVNKNVEDSVAFFMFVRQ